MQRSFGLAGQDRDPSPSPMTFRDVLNKQSPKLRLNAICAYFTMFPLAFPYHQLQGAHPGDWVLDPFCGRGTTNMAARLLGLPSIGIDSSPVATAIAEAKLCAVESTAVADTCNAILEAASPTIVPTGTFWELCYDALTLMQICQ